MKNICLIFLCVLIANFSKAQKSLDYYLPEGTTYDKNIPSPEEFLGYQIGEWHISHDQVLHYFKELARLSPRATLEVYGHSHEDRPLMVLVISSTKNHQNIDKIQKEHYQLTQSGKSGNLNTEEMPIVVYQGYTVHGNESSGANASPLLAYYLTAGQGKEVDEYLENSIILLDPVMNPDGMHRFSTWVNMHKSLRPNPDADTREHNEVWPGGRTNHYWFDLNRDWLLVQHPESQGRIKLFHKWKPNILTDHHEMGTNSTYFFQPGIPSRTNPCTPERNQSLTQDIAEFHAHGLDEIGSLYYSKESFDDFYYGKGSTYPDINGSVGILFEQASSRGHIQESIHGDLSFPFTIKNQVVTSFTTLKAANSLRTNLLNYQRKFFDAAKKEGASDPNKGIVYGDANDPVRVYEFTKLLKTHDIEIYPIANDQNLKGKSFKKGSAFFVPFNQGQYRLIKAMFEQRTTFTDSLFYDVSAWTLPLAFNMPFAETNQSLASDNPIKSLTFPKGQLLGSVTDYAFLMDWDHYLAPKVLSKLLEHGILAKVAHKPFLAKLNTGDREFGRGTIMIPLVQTNKNKKEIVDLLSDLTKETGLTIFGVKSGLTETGIDLGSPSFSAVQAPKALMLVGEGVTSYDAGEIWHLLDQRFDIPLAVVDFEALDYLELEKYNTLIMPNGGYSGIKESGVTKIKDWVKNGGSIVAMRGAVSWLKRNGLAGVSFRSASYDYTKGIYGSMSNDRGANYIGGAIFENKLDLTHPLCYGYRTDKLPVFRRGTMFMNLPGNSYASPLKYTLDPLLGGYISPANLQTLKGSSGAIVSRLGGGRIICLADNPNFRAYWFGTTKVFMNALFFGPTISSGATTIPSEENE